MKPTRLMNVLVALLLVAGQLASGVHLASHVAPEPAAGESAFVQGLAAHSAHDHLALEHAAHMHFHAHQAAETASIRDKSPEKSPEKSHNASDCTLCHLASHVLAASYRGSILPQPLVADKVFMQAAEHSLAQADTSAHAIRGPPRLFLI